ncbi:MAG: hypothetical protein HY840_08660 [Bacteroidetes bacterium]|nr:hypothetical protein [Bacteroidota bacterium]
MKKFKQITPKVLLCLFVFCFPFAKITAQQTYELLAANNNSTFSNNSNSLHFSASETQNMATSDKISRYQLLANKNHTKTPMINIKSLRYPAKLKLKIRGGEGAIIVGLAGAVFGFFAVNFNAHPSAPRSDQFYSALAGGVAFAPIGYSLSLWGHP